MKKPTARLTRAKIRSLLINKMPKWLKPHLYRRMINIDVRDFDKLELTIASNREDLSAAFRLLHENYVRSGFMDPHPSGMRITKYHILPSTTTLVAKLDGRVVATVGMVRNGLFGSPVESLCDLSEYRRRGGRIAEVSSLAVAREFSGQHGRILFALLNYLYQYSVKSFGVDYLAIAVNPSWWDFYEYILNFKRLSPGVHANYSFVNGAPAVVGILDLKTAPQVFENAYKNLPDRCNLYKGLFEYVIPGAFFPVRKYGEVSDPILTPDLFRHFFLEKNDVLLGLSDRELRALHVLYRNSEFCDLIPMPREFATLADGVNRDARHDAEILTKVTTANGDEITGSLKNISTKGAMIVADRGLRRGEELKVSFTVRGGITVKAVAQVVWSNGDGVTGVVIPFPSRDWQKLVQQYELYLHNSMAMKFKDQRKAG